MQGDLSRNLMKYLILTATEGNPVPSVGQLKRCLGETESALVSALTYLMRAGRIKYHKNGVHEVIELVDEGLVLTPTGSEHVHAKPMVNASNEARYCSESRIETRIQTKGDMHIAPAVKIGSTSMLMGQGAQIYAMG
jgi:hypothetical protein